MLLERLMLLLTSLYDRDVSPKSDPTDLQIGYIRPFGVSASKDNWVRHNQNGKLFVQTPGAQYIYNFVEGKLSGNQLVSTQWAEHSYVNINNDGEVSETTFTLYPYQKRCKAYKENDNVVWEYVLYDLEKNNLISKEVYVNTILSTGEYYCNQELVASIQNGTGTKHEYKKNNKLSYKAEVKDGFRVCEYTYHSNHDALKSRTPYENDLKHGTVELYDIYGNCTCSEEWERGLLNGNRKCFENGVLVSLEYYVSDRLHGTSYIYSKDGILKATCQWLHGLKHGMEHVYDETGQTIIARALYNHNVLIYEEDIINNTAQPKPDDDTVV